MEVKKAYNIWADQYDTNSNKTRDLESISLRETLSELSFDNCLEIGCGTGKNTEFLLTIANVVTAVDLSEQMLAIAKQKITAKHVRFIQANILKDWNFGSSTYDLVTFSLVLEHIEDLQAVFKKVSDVTTPKALVYIGELHPFKQYTGTKARFDTKEGQQIVTCYNHHISDFTKAAKEHGFEIKEMTEYFDDGDRQGVPRILTMVFRKR